MARMFVEAEVLGGASLREATRKLMRDLDDAAAKEGHRVCGDVTIMEFERDALALGPVLRLEADVEAAV